MNQGRSYKSIESSYKGFVFGLVGLILTFLIYETMNYLTLRLTFKGVHVGTEFRYRNENGLIDTFHQNIPSEYNQDTRREKMPVSQSRILYDAFEIIELKTID